MRPLDRLVAARWARGEIKPLGDSSIRRASLGTADLPPSGDWYRERPPAFDPDEDDHETLRGQRADVHAAIALHEPMPTRDIPAEIGLDAKRVKAALAHLAGRKQIIFDKEAGGWFINRRADREL